MTVQKYRAWLAQQLVENGIERDYLLALVIVLERVVNQEQQKLGSLRARPFYRLFVDNQPTRAWFYAAELALWLHYTGYDPYQYFRALCSMPPIRKWLANGSGEQVPLSVFMPSTRLGTERLRPINEYARRWLRNNGYLIDEV